MPIHSCWLIRWHELGGQLRRLKMLKAGKSRLVCCLGGSLERKRPRTLRAPNNHALNYVMPIMPTTMCSAWGRPTDDVKSNTSVEQNLGPWRRQNHTTKTHWTLGCRRWASSKGSNGRPLGNSRSMMEGAWWVLGLSAIGWPIRSTDCYHSVEPSKIGVSPLKRRVTLLVRNLGITARTTATTTW